MNDNVYLGNTTSKLLFENVSDHSWGKPTIIFNRVGFLDRKFELTDWQISNLIDSLLKFIESQKKYKQKESKNLKKKIDKIKEEIKDL